MEPSLSDRNLIRKSFLTLSKLDTGISATEFCKLQGGLGGKLKMPTLLELHKILFNKDFGDAHDASYDVAATARCFFGLLKQKVNPPFDSTPVEEIEYEEPNLEAGNSIKREKLKEAGYKLDEKDADPFRQTVCSPSRTFSILSITGNTRYQSHRIESKSIEHACRCDHGFRKYVWCF